MGFWSNLLSRKDPIPMAAMTPNVTYVGSGAELLDALNVRGLSVPQLWRTQPHLRTVVSFRARNIAHLGLHCFVRDGDDRQRDRTSPLALLLQRPNPDQTLYELIYSLVGDLDLYDRAYWLVVQDVDAPSGWALRRLPPSWVSVSKHTAFGVTEWQVASLDGSNAVRVPANQVLAFTGYHPTSPLSGSPTIESLRETLHEQVEAAKFRGQVWKRGGRVSAVLERPKDAPEWSNEAREAFREDWYSKYTGNGPKAGGTPILEDGMQLKRIDFNAQEQQYVEAAKLALSTVAAAYHINPTMVGVLDNANYSNVREFRRMLYGDSLGPTLAQVEDRINTFLLPMLGVDPQSRFVEFNIGEKLQGSFEEQTQALQASVGRPWMTADEARGLLNLPALGGEAEQLVTPLNVLVGGQASPRDAGSQNRGESSREVSSKTGPAVLKAGPTDAQREQVARVLSRFFDRQGKSVLSALGAGEEDWWDGGRWDAELADDLHRVATTVASIVGVAVADQLGYPDGYNTDRTVEFLRAVAERQAIDINATTREQIDEQLAADEGDPAHVFDIAKGSRAEGIGAGLSAFLAGFATVEAGRHIADAHGVEPTKTWVTGPNPRPEHSALNGTTVGIDDSFPNGMPWPGEGGGLNDVGCNCSVVVNIP